MPTTKTTHHILKNEADLILPIFPEGKKGKRGIFSAIISGFVGLAFQGVLSFSHNRSHKALCKAVSAMSIKTDIQRNKHNEFRKHFSYVWSLQCRNIRKTHVKGVHTLHSRQTMYKSLICR